MVYRSTCNQAMSGSLNQNTLIRNIKTVRSSCEDTDMSKLNEYFSTEFSMSACNSDAITNSEREVKIKFDNLQISTCNDKVMYVIMVTIKLHPEIKL